MATERRAKPIASLEPHPDVRSVTSTATSLTVEAREAGTAGNAIVTTVIAGAGLSWGAATLQDGGVPTFRQVAVPDDVGIISVGYIAGFVICVVAQGYDANGRFYWIEPGFTTIDALNFATAERAPGPGVERAHFRRSVRTARHRND